MDLYAAGKGNQRPAIILASLEGSWLARRVFVLSTCPGGGSVGSGEDFSLVKIRPFTHRRYEEKTINTRIRESTGVSSLPSFISPSSSPEFPSAMDGTGVSLAGRELPRPPDETGPPLPVYPGQRYPTTVVFCSEGGSYKARPCLSGVGVGL